MLMDSGLRDAEVYICLEIIQLEKLCWIYLISIYSMISGKLGRKLENVLQSGNEAHCPE